MIDKETNENLSDEQKILLYFLGRSGKEFYLLDINKLGLRNFKKAFNKIVKENVCDNLKWFDTKNNKYFLWNIYLWIIILLFSFFAHNFGLSIICFHNILYGLIFINKSFIHTYNGKLMELKWRAYKKYIKEHYENLKIDKNTLKNYIIYGVLWGYNRKILKFFEDKDYESLIKESISKWFITSSKDDSLNDLSKSLNRFIAKLNKVWYF